jgi:hypothetical protein
MGRTAISFTLIFYALKQVTARRMAPSGMLRHLALVITDVSEELSDSFIRVTRIDELGTTLTLTSNRRKLRRNTIGWYFLSP